MKEKVKTIIKQIKIQLLIETQNKCRTIECFRQQQNAPMLLSLRAIQQSKTHLNNKLLIYSYGTQFSITPTLVLVCGTRSFSITQAIFQDGGVSLANIKPLTADLSQAFSYNLSPNTITANWA